MSIPTFPRSGRPGRSASATHTLILATAFALSACGASPQPDDGQPGDVVIRDVTVVSPERDAPLEHAYVRIRDGRISEVSTRPLSAEREIDGAGRYLVPGLIDTHVHLGDVPGMLPAHEERDPDVAALARAQMPRSFLYYGFTTVVDLIGEPERIARWNDAELRPDAYFCGGAPIANGYPMVFLPEDQRFQAIPYFLYDERQRHRIPDSVDPEAHTPRAVVERMAADGAICVKTFYEPGFGAMRDLPTPTPETVRALVDAAHAADLPVLLHANSLEAQRFAVDAGADILAHGLWNGLDGAGAALGNDADAAGSDDVGATLGRDVDALLQAIVRDGVAFQPTIQVLHGELDLLDDGYLDDPSLTHAYPAALIDWYRTPEGGWFREQMAANYRGVDPAPIFDRLFRQLGGIVGTLASRDAVLLFGSDTPSAPT